MTTVNLFARLKQMLPPPPLLIGKILELHPDDDTSTVQLLMAGSTQTYDEALKTGNIIRARGQFVPVGQNAFVRSGVIETKAPDDIGDEIVVGRVVAPSAALTFSPNIGDQTTGVEAAFTLDVSTHWHGGSAPLRYTVASGALPSGLSLNSVTGAISGAPLATGTGTATFRATDASAVSVSSNPVLFTITSTISYLVEAPFNVSGTNLGTLGGTFVLGVDTPTGLGSPVSGTSPAIIDTSFKLAGAASLKLPPPYSDSGTKTPVAKMIDAGLARSPGDPFTVSAWVWSPLTSLSAGAFGGGPDRARIMEYSSTAGVLALLTSYPGSTMSKFKPALRVDGLDHQSATEVDRATWVHLAISVDALNVHRLFVNGVKMVEHAQSAFPVKPENAILVDAAGAEQPTWFDTLRLEDFAHVAGFTPPGAL